MRMGVRPLDKNSKAKLELITGQRSSALRDRQPGAILGLLSDEKLTAFAVPVMAAEKARSGQPTGPFDAVEIVIRGGGLIETNRGPIQERALLMAGFST